jgi:hypothetical protein
MPKPSKPTNFNIERYEHQPLIFLKILPDWRIYLFLQSMNMSPSAIDESFFHNRRIFSPRSTNLCFFDFTRLFVIDESFLCNQQISISAINESPFEQSTNLPTPKILQIEVFCDQESCE